MEKELADEAEKRRAQAKSKPANKTPRKATKGTLPVRPTPRPKPKAEGTSSGLPAKVIEKAAKSPSKKSDKSTEKIQKSESQTKKEKKAKDKTKTQTKANKEKKKKKDRSQKDSEMEGFDDPALAAEADEVARLIRESNASLAKNSNHISLLKDFNPDLRPEDIADPAERQAHEIMREWYDQSTPE